VSVLLAAGVHRCEAQVPEGDEVSRAMWMALNFRVLESPNIWLLTDGEFRAFLWVACHLSRWDEPAAHGHTLNRLGLNVKRRRKLVEIGLLVERPDGLFEIAVELVRHQPKSKPAEAIAGPGYTYVIQSGDDGPVKIGRTTKTAEKRVADLQTAHFAPLHIRRLYEGVDYERVLHEQFADLRLNGEWFKPEVLDYLEDTA
jgi:hypothetical protein